MAQAQQGDKKAYNDLLTAVSETLKKYLHHRLSDAGHRDDVRQQILMKMHVCRHTYDSTLPFEPWMFAIARSVTVDHFRAFGRKQAAELLTDDTFDEAATSCSEALGTIALDQALATLSPEQKEALQLMKIDGLSVEEAAKRVGTSASNMKVRTHRALKALRAALDR